MSRNVSLPRFSSARSRWLLLGAAAVVGVGAFVAWYTLVRDDDEATAPVEEGAIVEGVAGSWQRVNPLFASLNETDQDLSALIFAGLVKNGPDGQPEPDLAELPEISADGRTYTFVLREGLTWHDGEPVTSADVAFTLSAIMDPDFRGAQTLAEPWVEVTVATPDARMVVLTLPEPLAAFTARYATVGILPAHLLEGLTAQELFEAPFNQAPVGSGPYRLISLDASEAVLDGFDDYHAGAPATGKMRVRFFPDYLSATSALSLGEVDSLMVREPLTQQRLSELEAMDGISLTVYERPVDLIVYLNNSQALFADARVRKAVSLAIDRQALADAQVAGLATVSTSVIPPSSWAYASQYDDTARDVAAAAALLDEAGWVLDPQTGVRTREGIEFRFTIRTDNDPQRTAMAGMVAQQLEELGLRATVASTTFLVLARDYLRERRYDAALIAWDQGADPDPYTGWHSSQLGTAGLNLANFQDVIADELMAAARTTNDVVVRTDLYRQFQERWEELAPSAPLLYPRFLYVTRGTIEGIGPVMLVTPASRFYNVHLWTR